nr:MAG TPA: minor capsid protein [Caudoviricetes sp.]
MGARERFEQAASKISDYYQALEGQIFNLIVNALKKGDYKHVDQNDVVMWQAQQLSKINQLNRQVIKLLSKKDGISKQAIEDMVKFHGMAITDEIDSQLERLTDKDIGVSDEVKLLVSGIAQQTWTDLQNNVNESLVSRNYGQSAVTKAYRQVLTESTTATVTGLMTHADAVQSAMYRVVDKGLPTNLTDKAGRNWSLEGYTRMVVNTTVNRTFNEVRLQRMSDFDMHLALMSSHPNSRPACAPIQGHVVNLVSPSDPDFDPHYDSIFNHGYGEPAGTQGINCRHILFPYEPGVSENHQPQYDPGEAIANGKLVQQQRARERAIRDAKKRLAVAEQLGDKKMISQTKTLLQARQAKLRQFISENNAGRDTPLLTRDYTREKIVENV